MKIATDETMGNQQERSLSWLAGILDGEGTISFQVYTMPDGRVRITPFIALVNSDPGILSEAYGILQSICDGHRFAMARWCNKPHSKTWTGTKECKQLRIDGAGCKWVLETVGPYLRSMKRKSAEVVLQFLELRKANGVKRDERGRILRVGYSREEVELACSIRSHKSAKSSEAICQAPNVIR